MTSSLILLKGFRKGCSRSVLCLGCLRGELGVKGPHYDIATNRGVQHTLLQTLAQGGQRLATQRRCVVQLWERGQGWLAKRRDPYDQY